MRICLWIFGEECSWQQELGHSAEVHDAYQMRGVISEAALEGWSVGTADFATAFINAHLIDKGPWPIASITRGKRDTMSFESLTDSSSVVVVVVVKLEDTSRVQHAPNSWLIRSLSHRDHVLKTL